MQWSGWIYFGGTVALFIAFVVAVVYYFSPKRKSKVEEPKFRMLQDDDEPTGKNQADKSQKNEKEQ
jgi:cbb3-type cytochrome oxidase subunit 3